MLSCDIALSGTVCQPYRTKMAEKFQYAFGLRFLFLVCSVASVCKGVMFDYGTQQMTENDKHYIDLRLYGLSFPFYGSTFKNVYISKDGMIGFSSDVGYNTVTLGSPTIKVSVDKPFVAPFRFRGLGLAENIGDGSPNPAQIYYKVIPAGHNDLKNLSSIIRSSVVGSNSFEATWALTVTWFDVISLPDALNCRRGQTPCPTSTFQATILTDGINSFAIFNYEKMGIQISSSDNYQAGFNGGRGFGWTQILQRNDLQRANTLQAGDVVGRIIYKISGERMIRGGCLPRNSNTGHLEVYPLFAGMYGGEMLQVSGKCLQQQDRIICKFGDGSTAVTTPGYYIDSMKFRCAVPRLASRGRVKLSMSVDGGNTFGSAYYITIIHPSRMQRYVKLTYNGKGSGWNETSPDYLTLNWDDIDQISNKTNANVNVYLVGYRENSTQAIWRNLKTLGTNIPLSERTLRFRVKDFDCVSGMDCTMFEIGIVEVRLVNETDATMFSAINSGVLPLGWFLNSAMYQTYGKNWPQSRCINWYNADKRDMTWMNELLSCPCTLHQAIVDIGRFQADVGCNMFDPQPNMCRYHIGAVHCVRAVQPTPKGSGNQCCYGANGLLKYAADSYQGSTPDRSHDWGSYPYNGRDLVPSLSHWIHDVVTFYYCCLWTGYNDCDYYMDQRATKDCTGYQVPRAAIVYGHGHINTLDNTKFRMCSQGDYTLLKGSDFTIQGRFQYSAVNATYNNMTVILTNIAVKTRSETIEIRLRHPTVDRSKRYLDVLVNNTYQLFDNKEMYWQDFKESAVVNTDSGSPNKQANFTIIMKNGIGIQAADKGNIMFVNVFVPPNMKYKVNGILGSWNDNTTDDLTPDEANSPIQPGNSTSLFLNFQYSWRITSQSFSIIPHSITVDNNTNLCNLNLPVMLQESQCFGNQECLFDKMITGSRSAALNTKKASDWISQMRTFMQPVRSCGLLNVPRSSKNNYNYTLGSTITVTGCRKGALSGTTTYTCASTSNMTQMWSPSITATCQVSVEEADVGMIAGIVIAVLIVIIIIIIIVAVILRRKRKPKGTKYGEDNPTKPNPIYSEVQKESSEEPKRRPSKEYSI